VHNFRCHDREGYLAPVDLHRPRQIRRLRVLIGNLSLRLSQQSGRDTAMTPEATMHIYWTLVSIDTLVSANATGGAR
jgi:hypothetical protein